MQDLHQPRTGAPTIWVDVEDFVQYFAFNPHPSGIQRLAFEIERALVGAGPPVRFVCRGPGGDGALLEEVPWDTVQALFHEPPPAASTRSQPRERRPLRLAARLPRALPSEVMDPLRRAGVLQQEVGRNVQELLHVLRPPPPVRLRDIPAAPATSIAPSTGGRGTAGAPVQPGDCFLALGAPWSVPGFSTLIAGLRQRCGMVIGLLLYDLIPVRHPEWYKPDSVADFAAWLQETLPLCDRLLASSRYTARDVEAYAREQGIPLRAPVTTIPIGTGLPSLGVAATRPRGLPQPGSYVLFVSTLEARKNHALAVRVWRKLADDVRAGRRPAGSVPELVFAGRVGAMVADLLQQLENMAWLDGRVRLIRDPSDAELQALYEGCRFTLFPSLAEGWGLPISESLAFGKPCLASSAASLPEAGGALCRYFDPEDVGAAHRAVAALLDDPAAIPAWQDQVRREFRPTPWSEPALALVAALAEPRA